MIYLYSHVDEVGGGHIEDLLGELLPVLEDLVHRHGAHDGPLVALQGGPSYVLRINIGLARAGTCYVCPAAGGE